MFNLSLNMRKLDSFYRLIMVKISEKRTIKIPPTKIDGNLLFNVGKILKDECPKQYEISIRINADSRDIETGNYEELKDLEIPADTYKIVMETRSEIEMNPTDFPIRIEIDTVIPKKNSKIQVKGENATWVQGVGERIFRAFEKNKLLHRHIAKFENVRLVMSIITSALLSLAVGFAIWYCSKEFVWAFYTAFLSFYLFVYILKRFFDWLFPYFDIINEDFKPRKVRKWALTLLWSSGILTNIIFYLLSLPR